jgi:manganese/zinc/iron transport system permease protein
MTWTTLDTWTVVAGALIAMACAVPGAYLVLMRNSLFGDAVSHAVLPGLAIGFLLTGNRDPITMLFGAVCAGGVTAVFSHWIQVYGKLEQGASLGVVFCSLFALGLILIRLAADRVDLDPDCVLYGTIETAVLDVAPIPSVVLVSGGILAVNLLVVLVFWKELRIAAFDPALAKTLGFRPYWIRQGINIMTATTAVVAFESVGSILVIAMLVAPAVSATLLSDRLGRVILWSLGLAALSAPLGHILATWGMPAAATLIIGQPIGAVSTAGMMAVASGLLLTLALAYYLAREKTRRRVETA